MFIRFFMHFIAVFSYIETTLNCINKTSCLGIPIPKSPKAYILLTDEIFFIKSAFW